MSSARPSVSRDPGLWLQDILRGCDRILRYVGDRTREEALGDDLILDDASDG